MNGEETSIIMVLVYIAISFPFHRFIYNAKNGRITIFRVFFYFVCSIIYLGIVSVLGEKGIINFGHAYILLFEIAFICLLIGCINTIVALLRQPKRPF